MELIITLLICAVGIIGGYLLYTCYLLESPARLATLLVLSPLFLLGVGLRKPIVAACEWIHGGFITGQPLFFDLGIAVSTILLLMAPVIEESLKGGLALILVFIAIKGRNATSEPTSILRSAALAGFSFGLMEAVFLAVKASSILTGLAIIGFSFERIAVAVAHTAMTTIFLFYAFGFTSGDRGGRFSVRAMCAGLALAILLHTLLNASIVLLMAPEQHAYLRLIGIPYLICCFAFLFCLFAAIYVRIEKLTRTADREACHDP